MSLATLPLIHIGLEVDITIHVVKIAELHAKVYGNLRATLK